MGDTQRVTPDDVLTFWFGPDFQKRGREDANGVLAENLPRWFGGGPSFDEAIRERFGATVEAALDGGLDEWGDSPRGRLALVLVFDQFTRNIFRGDGRSFAGDDAARALTKAAIRAGDEAELTVPERQFLLMPLMHSELLADQDACIEHFRALAEVDEGARGKVEGSVDYAIRHRDIIARFGRFPHRNAWLGRETTPEEAEFLKQPGSSF